MYQYDEYSYGAARRTKVWRSFGWVCLGIAGTVVGWEFDYPWVTMLAAVIAGFAANSWLHHTDNGP